MTDIEQFENRKTDHIREALREVNQTSQLSGLDRVHLYHDALPEIDLRDVNLSARCLNQTLPTPFYVSGMTAGHAGANPINRVLAAACERRGWAMGVGSQRRELENDSSSVDA
jgi:isopentenyl-diphosphate delta-isomerase